MKDLLRKIAIRDKIVTAACRTADGIDWTTLKVRQDGNETLRQSSLPLPNDALEDDLALVSFPETLSERNTGEVTVALRSSGLLMRTVRLPTSDPDEISNMIDFQVDRISPFPLEQLAISYEILNVSADTSQVLLAAVKREDLNAIGDLFRGKGVRIHSIDVRVLGWLQLVRDAEQLTVNRCELLVFDDGVDFVLTVLHEGVPVIFRSLYIGPDHPAVVQLAYEIGYTLVTLDAELDLPAPSVLHFWSFGGMSPSLQSELSEQCTLDVILHDLGGLPPLSEGLLRRMLNDGKRIELIPREWLEHQKQQKILKQFFIVCGGISVVWLIVMLLFMSVFKIRALQLKALKADADAIAPAANQAAANQKKLKALKVYADRSDSSLECLREVTRLLPPGDIEFLSYNYNKGKGVTLRGSARDDDIVYEFFKALTRSGLFERLKDQSVNTRITKSVKRTVFSVTLQLSLMEERE